ncbi:MAG: STAS domain-containing protein [Candidatus Goldbacteria bacterium]|nr:STAS domain-containing protein [Candidatus Goldiibacteriota bacterium]
MNLILDEKQSSNGAVILSANGFIDTSTSSAFEEKIKKFYSENKTKIVLDLSKTEFISSAGWGIMIAYLKRMRNNGGDIRLASMTENVEKVFKLMEFDNLIDSYKSVDEAVKSYKDI